MLTCGRATRRRVVDDDIGGPAAEPGTAAHIADATTNNAAVRVSRVRSMRATNLPVEVETARGQCRRSSTVMPL